MGLYVDGDEAEVGGDAEGGVGDGTGDCDVAGGAEIVADDATWLLDGEVGAGSCFLPFLAMGECWRTESPSLTL